MNPRKYFTSGWNAIDLLGILFSMISPANYMRNIIVCQSYSEDSACVNHVPDSQWRSTSVSMFYLRAFGSLILMFKLLYYLRPYKSLSYLVRSIISILDNLKTFLFLYVISTIAFADAFFTASQYHQQYKLDDEKTYYASF